MPLTSTTGNVYWGRYIVHKYGDRWLVVYADKQDYCISDHATAKEAIAAAKRYDARDKRMALSD